MYIEPEEEDNIMANFSLCNTKYGKFWNELAASADPQHEMSYFGMMLITSGMMVMGLA